MSDSGNGANNDATILESLLIEGSPLLNYLQPNKDHVVLDRGFRDNVTNLKAMKIKVHMPELKAQNRNGEQFSTRQAIKSRQVTMVRWLVEAINGKLKMKYKFFSDVIPGSYLPKLRRFFRITMALINCFCPTLIPNSSRRREIALAALAKCDTPNQLQQRIIRNHFNNPDGVWERASSTTVTDFPKLSIGKLA